MFYLGSSGFWLLESRMNSAILKAQESTGSYHELENLLLTLVNHLDAMVAYWDINQTCVFANAAYADWFGRNGSELVGVTLKSLLGPLYEKNLPYIEAAYAGQKQVFERAIPRPNGGIRHSLATYYPHVVAGKVHGIFVHVADVGPLKKLEHELVKAVERADRLATHDFLTGLPNRALLSETTRMAIAQAKRNSEGFALMSMDLDKFKAVNDEFGHVEGDRYLVEMALRMKNCIREGDTLLRIGGDEFVLVALKVTSDADAQALAERLLLAVRAPLRIREKNLTPSLSVGIAVYPRHGTTLPALLHASDDALYSAKNSGRNRKCIATPAPVSQ
jgi:diguanylate cyclase (GGDEF)-like protein/PAS domain S-box-containing protein